MANSPFLLVSAAACCILYSCQSAPVADTLSLEKHEAELGAAAGRSRELEARLRDAERERDRLTEALKAAEKVRAEGERSKAEYENKLAASERRLKALEDENVRISAALDELNFARMAGLMAPRPADTAARTEPPAPGGSPAPAGLPAAPPASGRPAPEPPRPKAGPAELAGLIAVKVGPGIRYYDAAVNPAAERVLCLFALESEPGRLSLWLHYGATMTAEEARGTSSISFIADGTALPLAFPASSVTRENAGRAVREAVELEVTPELWRFTRSLLAAGSVRIVHRMADSTRERLLSAAEKRAMGNLLYAYRELGGVLP